MKEAKVYIASIPGRSSLVKEAKVYIASVPGRSSLVKEAKVYIASVPGRSSLVKEAKVYIATSIMISLVQVVASKNSLLGLDEPSPTLATTSTHSTPTPTRVTTSTHSTRLKASSAGVSMAPTRRKAIADSVVRVLTPFYKKGKISSKVSLQCMSSVR